MASATIIQKSTDKMVVLPVRTSLIYPFTAPNWTDLRIGMFLSATSVSADDDPSALSETLTTTGVPGDRVWLGVKNNDNDTLPTQASTSFIGYGNQVSATDTTASSLLQTFNSNSEWRALISGNVGGPQGWDATTRRNYINSAGITMGEYAANDPAALWGYLFILRLTRPNGSSTSITTNYYLVSRASVQVSSLVKSATPTNADIRSKFRSLTSFTEGVLGPDTYTKVPDAVFLYWPFSNSRLRVSSLVVEKFA